MMAKSTSYDIVIKGGTIYDGSGSDPYEADLAIIGDTIAKIEPSIKDSAKEVINASDHAVSPGFINMLSWANESLIEDGRSLSDIKQGVTLEVLGEGTSMGPLNEKMKIERQEKQGDIKYDVCWSSLREYLDFLVDKGISTNVASFVGATTARVNVIGKDDRPPRDDELSAMQNLVETAMKEGAIGLSTALIYAPAAYAQTDEITALAKVAARYNGMYISHLRSEGDSFLSALDEFISITNQSGARSEIYHLKAAGKNNWHKMDAALDKIATAHSDGMTITADMYMYEAANTGLDVSMPPWVQEGGLDAWIERLKNPDIRARVKREMSTQSDDWENGYLNAGGADGIILIGFNNERLKKYTGMRLSEIAEARQSSPEETIMDLIIEDRSRVDTVYFWICEENIKKQIVKPWISLGSDGSSIASEGVFLKSSNHPRAYGNTARFLSRYVRDLKLMSLQEGVRRLTSLPANNMRVNGRGLLKQGNFADVVVFDPDKIQDHATFANPHQYSQGVSHVLVNGGLVVKNGEHTGVKTGRVVLGPGAIT